MQEQSSVFGGAATSLELRYTGKPVSGWGGLVVVMRYLERRGVRGVLESALPDGRTSPNQIPVVDMVLAFFAAVLSGSRRFAHIERLRSDEVVRTMLGLARMPSAMTLTRYFGGFVRGQVEHLSAVLGQFVFGQLKRPALGATLDLDSTVFERYGHQEGSLKGYNPRKHGRPSHHPLLAILAEAKLVLHAWLRSGNTASARGVKAFLAETLARVPEDFRFYAVRADSGFFLSEFLEELEQRALPYAIAVRMNPLLRRAVAGTRGRKLLEVPGYTFHVLVTTLSLDPVQTWRFYNSRAESENRLKELKEDFGADGFCLQSFYGTEAAFRLICFLFNLIANFKREVTQDESSRLITLRTKLLVSGAILGAEGRHTVLRLGLRDRWRQRFIELLERIAALAISTVAQLTDYLKTPAPRPWKPRRAARQQHLVLMPN